MTRPRLLVPILLGVWLVAAIAVGAAGLLSDLRPPVPQVILIGLTLLCLVALYRVPPVRSWAMEVDPRLLVGFHLTRFVGIYFLVLYREGQLPFDFAVIGGWGDIVVAGAAGILLLSGPPTGVRRWPYQAWNVVGLVDILFVVATATRTALVDPASMAPLLRMPLSLLITFIVPLVIASHVWLLRRLAEGRDGRT